MNERLKEKLSVLPEQPGCYLMKDKHGTVIYVGKAKSLKARVRSYFTGTHDGKTQRLVEEIADFEYIVTSSNAEALILEMNLIKKHDPKYNVMLKDDKSYPFIKITAEQHPRLLITRKVKKRRRQIFRPVSERAGGERNEKAARPFVSAPQMFDDAFARLFVLPYGPMPRPVRQPGVGRTK